MILVVVSRSRQTFIFYYFPVSPYLVDPACLRSSRNRWLFPSPEQKRNPHARVRGKMNVATFALGGFEGVCCQKRSGFVTRIVTPILVLKSFPGNVLFIGGGNYRRVIAPRETNKRLADERAVNSNLCETSSNVLSSSFFFFLFLKWNWRFEKRGVQGIEKL